MVEETGSSIAPPGEKPFDAVVNERKKKVLMLLHKKSILIFLALIFLVWLGIFIRTRNLPGLKDITTNSWTLGPDLDPFLFLRYAEYIVEHGGLMDLDMMRYVPLGFNTGMETKLLPYLIAYLYKIASLFAPMSIEYAAVLYPVVAFALTTIVFFFFVRELFRDQEYAGIIALISTSLLVVSPLLLSRTIAGIPEKESSILFMFAAFYFFLLAWRQASLKKALLFGVLAGVMSGLMGLIWGAILYLFMPLEISVFLAFILGKTDRTKMIAYSSWLMVFQAVLLFFSERYPLMSFITSPHSSLMYLNLLLFVIQLSILHVPKLSEFFRHRTGKFPLELFSLGIALVFVLLAAFLFLGPQDISERISSFVRSFTSPIGSRFGLTVAENRQPYFGEWRGSFGPEFKGIPLFFWLFFIGSIVLMYHMLQHVEQKKGLLLTCLYTLMLFGIIFSRYDPGSSFNGVNFKSKTVYFGSILLFLTFSLYTYLQDYREKKKQFVTLPYSYLFLFSFFFVALAAARSAVRFLMMLVPPVVILTGFFSVFSYTQYRRSRTSAKTLYLIIAVLVLFATAYTFYFHYQASKGSAPGFIPSSYTYQWQRAMAWVRQNTPQDAVFAHWWDYGYWVQSIGKRATVLDGGNAIVYWDHLMGRHVLTGPSNEKALEFLYTHKSTHLLIDSTDIGKYGAYASIGGDEKHDRAGFIPTLLKDDQKTFETKNELVYVYPSGFGLDEDVVWEVNGSKQIFSSGGAGVGGVFIKVDKNSSLMNQPEVVLFDQFKNTQTRVPLRYLYYNQTLTEFPSGIDAGVMIVPRLIQQGNSVGVDPLGALLYFSKRTVHSRMVRLFLLEEKNEGFELVHTEPNLLIENLRQQGLSIGDFVFFGDILGPIKIWKINYPESTQSNPEWLEREFPSEILWRA